MASYVSCRRVGVFYDLLLLMDEDDDIDLIGKEVVERDSKALGIDNWKPVVSDI